MKSFTETPIVCNRIKVFVHLEALLRQEEGLHKHKFWCFLLLCEDLEHLDQSVLGHANPAQELLNRAAREYRNMHHVVYNFDRNRKPGALFFDLVDVKALGADKHG